MKAHKEYQIVITRKKDQEHLDLRVKTSKVSKDSSHYMDNADLFALIESGSTAICKALKLSKEMGFDSVSMLKIICESIENEVLPGIDLDELLHENGSD